MIRPDNSGGALNKRDIELAGAASRILALSKGKRPRVRIGSEKTSGETVEIPGAAVGLLADMLDQMAHGNTVRLVASQAELTTQQAADFLNVSRPFLVKLIESGAIPFHRVGTHRRLKFQDVMAYKQRQARQSRAALNELAAQAQELSMGY